jgi:hypothetical protein
MDSKNPATPRARTPSLKAAGTQGAAAVKGEADGTPKSALVRTTLAAFHAHPPPQAQEPRLC